MQTQIPLQISLRDDATFDNFHVGGNAAVVHSLQLMVETAADPFIYIWGRAGSGKTHLLQAVCHEAGRHGLGVGYLSLAGHASLPLDALNGLEQLALVCIDDVHSVAGSPPWETGLFDLYNRVRDARGRMVVAGEASPAGSGFDLVDLASRLAWGPVFHLQELDDAGKRQALFQRAAARGVDMPEEVANYLISRCPRDMDSLFRLLDRLDEASLSAQRRLTIPFVRELIS
jgi:DnaA family protein